MKACLCTGGPDRWRVITISAGGRHSLVLALPDNGDLLHHDLDATRISPLLRSSQGSLNRPPFMATPPGARLAVPETPVLPPGVPLA